MPVPTSSRLLRLALLLSVVHVTPLRSVAPAGVARRRIVPPAGVARLRPAVRPPPVLMAMEFEADGEDEEGDENFEMVPYEDWNLAWDRYKLEYLAQAYEVTYEYESDSANGVSASLVGAFVACACMAICLHAYVMATGGIIIAPPEGGSHAPIELHNFRELNGLDKSHLMQLQLPWTKGAQLRDMVEGALQTGELAGWRALIVSNTFNIVLDGAL